MAYGLPPWELEDWPSVWVYRTLAALEEVEPEDDRPGGQQAAVVDEAVAEAMRSPNQPP